MFMNKRGKILSGSLAILATIVVVGMIIDMFLTISNQNIINEIKVGQTWSYLPYGEDPFKEEVVVYYRVLNVKNGYVQYVRDGRDTSSLSINVFRYHSKLVK